MSSTSGETPMSSHHPILKYLSHSLDRACATMVGSSLAGFCCVTMAVQIGFDATAGIAFSMLLMSTNMLLIYRACDNGRTDEDAPLTGRIVGMVIRLVVPVFFWALGVYSAFVVVR